MIESCEKTLNDDRRDAYRIAHDTFYVQVCDGVKIKLQSEKVGKETNLVLANGLPIASHIMVMGLVVGKKVIVEGEYKKVNSGVPVLIENAINKVLKTKGVKEPKSFSLEKGKYESFKISNEVLV